MAIFWRNNNQIQTAFLAEDDRFGQIKQIMRATTKIGLFASLSLVGSCLISHPLAAQITSDGTLDTTVNITDNVTEITGGTKADSNLFHSFQDFSVETGDTAFFNNDADINNIISRVTGNNLSQIDGLIKANGSANLILLNPRGISFGGNASLDIGGSFLGSTADSLVFEDGTVFNTDATVQPLLTVSTPIGLQLGQNSGAIQVSGLETDSSNLTVTPGSTFALVGNGITFNGGVITAESGRIELGSVEEGQVSITNIDAGWQLGYEGVTQFADLQLLAEASLFNPNDLANVTGGIQVQGKNVLLERSQIVAQTLGNAPGGNIVVNATESLSLTGVSANNQTSSQITNDVALDASGQGGSISIVTNNLNIAPRSFIGSTTFGTGNGGDINISATDINLRGTGFSDFQQEYQLNAFDGTLQPSDRNTGIFAGTAETGTAGNIGIETNSLELRDGAIIFSPVFTAGTGGDIDIIATDTVLAASALEVGAGINSNSIASVGNINLTTERLQVSEGATIINLTFGDAVGGDININVDDSIELRNTPLNSLVVTGIITNTSFGSGTGGDININADTLTIDNAGILSNSGALLTTTGQIVPLGGLGGDINIQADESIEATGTIPNPLDSETAIGSGIGTSTFSAADGGNLTVVTGKLTLRDGASFASGSFGAGNGGELSINATNSVELIGSTSAQSSTQVGLFATSGDLIPLNDTSSTVNGTSGNINITTPELIVRDGAAVDVQSFGTGKAGSLEIFANSILLENRGTLSASTVSGRGGDITITTNTLQLNRGFINASVFGSGTGSNIEIKAKDTVNVIGSGFEFLQGIFFDPRFSDSKSLADIDADFVTEGILAATTGSGQAGSISIETPNLQLREGALVATATAGNGAAGSIVINTDQSLTLDASIISGSNLFAGQGGDILIDTNRLEVLAGSQITSTTLGSGDGGSVIINATESVKVQGSSDNNILASGIDVGAQPLPTATGNGGDLTIDTANLNLDDRGTISVGSIGTGNAGTLKVEADSITLDNESAITADTQAGGGGNIFLRGDNIFWRGASITSATAGGRGNGGNIIIDAKNLVALEGSQLTANAFMGMGGNIDINTQGLFICGECQVTASSSLGVDGIVDIETLEPNTLDTLDVPQQPTQPQEVVAVACPSEKGASTSQLTITGRGGLPNRPQELLNASSVIEFEDPSAPTESLSTISKPTLPPPARSWYQDAQGNVILTAQAIANSPENSVSNSVDCHQP